MRKLRLSRMTIAQFICLATLLCCCTLSIASETGPHKGIAKHDILMKHLLGLSSDQVKAIEIIRNSYQNQMEQARENIHFARDEFRKKVEVSDDEAAIRLAYVPLAKAMEDMTVSRTLMMKEIKQVLSAEQSKKEEELRGELFKNRKKSRRPFPGLEVE